MKRVSPTRSNGVRPSAKFSAYGLLYAGMEETFDRITRLAARLFKAPTAAIMLADGDRQWFESRYGLDAAETASAMAFCTHAILKDEVMIVPDANKDPRFAKTPLIRHKPHIRFFAAAPLVTQDGVNFGTLCVIDRVPRELSVDEHESLIDLARLVVQAFELRRLVSLDPVTGLLNRQFFEDHLGREHKRALRNGTPLAVVMIGLDHFDVLAGDFGAAIADQILQNVTRLLRDQLRDSDLIVRYGAEEFAILLPDTDAHGSQLVAEHLRHEVEFATFMTEKGDVQVTASIGLAQCDPKVETVEQTLAKALRAIKAAAMEGGNRITTAGSAGGSELGVH